MMVSFIALIKVRLVNKFLRVYFNLHLLPFLALNVRVALCAF
jgi:hypothetical protein